MTPQVARRVLALMVVGHVAALLFFLKDYYIDDSFIHARYAQNLANGYGFTYNAGDEGSYGATSPLFTLLLAAFHWIGHPLAVAKTIGLLSASTNILLLYILVRMALEQSGLSAPGARFVAVASALLLATNPLVARWSFAGMETALFITFLLATQLGLVCAMAGGDRRLFAATGVGLGLATLVRPEAFVWIIALLVWPAVQFVRDRELRKSTATGAAVMLVTCFVVVGAWFAYALTAFGTVVPNTVLAKGAAFERFSSPLLAYYRRFVEQFAATSLVALVPIALLAVLAGPRRLAEGYTAKRSLWVLPNFAFLLLFAITYWANNGEIISRYLTALVPSVIVIGAAGTSLLLSCGRLRLGWSLHPRSVAFPAAVSATVFLALMVVLVAPQARAHARSNEELASLGRWLGRNTPQDSIVAALDIGVIGYYSSRDVLDMNGLATRDIIEYLVRGDVYAYLVCTQPDYIVVPEDTLPSIVPADEMKLLTERYRVHYSSFKLFDETGGDYIIYEFQWPASSQKCA